MIDRYSRQTILPWIGAEGQQKLAQSHVLLVGCGALGTVIASALVRSGIVAVKICSKSRC